MLYMRYLLWIQRQVIINILITLPEKPNKKKEVQKLEKIKSDLGGNFILDRCTKSIDNIYKKPYEKFKYPITGNHNIGWWNSVLNTIKKEYSIFKHAKKSCEETKFVSKYIDCFRSNMFLKK